MRGIHAVKVILGRQPGDSALATIDVSPEGRVHVTPNAGMHDHRELLTVIGEVVHAVLNIDPRSPQASQAVQAVRSSAKAIAKSGSSGF